MGIWTTLAIHTVNYLNGRHSSYFKFSTYKFGSFVSLFAYFKCNIRMYKKSMHVHEYAGYEQ